MQLVSRTFIRLPDEMATARTRLVRQIAAFAIGFLFSCWMEVAPASAPTDVDLELVLAVDISLSMDMDEQRLQRDGYVAAFRDPQIWAAIKSGPRGRIAVSYVEWAGPAIQLEIAPWTLIDGPDTASQFADKLEATRISRERLTSISAALSFAGRSLERNPFRGTRQVIDVSGDGPNNAGQQVTIVRDELVAKGIIINGLPLLLKTGGPNGAFDIPNLDDYYADCVIGGTGSFSIPVRKKEEFASAIRQKLLLEISGLAPARPLSPPLVIRTQAVQPPRPREPADCTIGEKMWRRYLDDRYR